MAGAWHKVSGRHNANAWKCTTCSGGGFNFWVRPNKDNCPQCQAPCPRRPKLFKDSADAGGGSNGWSKNGSGDSKAQKQQQRIKDLERQLQKARQHPTAEADQAEDVEADSRTPSALEGTKTFLEGRLKTAQAAAKDRPACTIAAQDVEKAKADLEDVHRQLHDSKDPDEKIRAKKRRLRNLSSKQARLLDTINKAMDDAEAAEKKQLEAQAEHAAARVEKEQLEKELAELEAATAALKPPDVQGVSNAVETLVNDVAKKLLTPGLPSVLAQDGKAQLEPATADLLKALKAFAALSGRLDEELQKQPAAGDGAASTSTAHPAKSPPLAPPKAAGTTPGSSSGARPLSRPRTEAELLAPPAKRIGRFDGKDDAVMADAGGK